jgi:hypothetical protein
MPETTLVSSPLPAVSDPARLRTLRETGLLDSPPDEALDRITRLARRALDAERVLITLIDEDRQFFGSESTRNGGTGERETPMRFSFCQYVVATGRPLNVPDARQTELLRRNPAVQDGAIAYAGVPLEVGGQILGTVCAVESRPREWTDEELGVLTDFSALAAGAIRSRRAVGREPAAQNHVAVTPDGADLVERVERAARTAKDASGSDALSLRTDGPVHVSADGEALERSLSALFVSCLSYVEPGTAIGADARVVDEGSASVGVTCPGRPMPAEDVAALVSRFASANGDGGEPRLTVVGETTLVEKGRVRASSSPSGTTFRIVLPRVP